MTTRELRAYAADLARRALGAGDERDRKHWRRRLVMVDELINERHVQAILSRGPGAEHSKDGD